MVCPTVQAGGTAMNSVCMRRPAEFFRIVEARASATRSRRRQLLEDLGLLVLRQVFQDVDRVVGIELAHALGDGLGRQFLEDLLAHRIVDFGQRREVEVGAHQLDQLRPQIGIERLDQVADIGLVQFADQRAQQARVAPLRSPRRRVSTNSARIAPLRRAAPGRRDRPRRPSVLVEPCLFRRACRFRAALAG